MEKLFIKKLQNISKTFIVIAVIFTTVSCVNGQRIRGNNIIATEERSDIKNFDKINISAGLTAIITQGEKEFIEVEADQNLLNHIITEVRGNKTLSIRWKRNICISRYKKATIHITLKQLKAVRASSSADVVSTNTLKVNNIDLDASSSAEIKLIFDAESINIDASSSAEITISGTTENLNADASSSAEIKARRLIAQHVRADASSAADIDVCAEKSIVANASSAADINYYGNPQSTKVHSSSGGDVDKK